MLERMAGYVAAAGLLVLSTAARAEPSAVAPPTRVNTTMAITGALAFAASYVMSVSIAAANASGYSASRDWTTNALFLPVAGPFISTVAAARSEISHDCSWACGVVSSGEALLVIDGITQGAGLALLVAGLVMRVPLRTKLRPTPIVAKNFSGLGLSGQF